MSCRANHCRQSLCGQQADISAGWEGDGFSSRGHERNRGQSTRGSRRPRRVRAYRRAFSTHLEAENNDETRQRPRAVAEHLKHHIRQPSPGGSRSIRNGSGPSVTEGRVLRRICRHRNDQVG